MEGDDDIVVRFTNGAWLRFREPGDRVAEAWTLPDDTVPAVTAREEDITAETLALRDVAEDLSFDGRRHAVFVRGDRNRQALLGGHP